MPVPDPVITLIREWLTRAENELKNAAHTLSLGEIYPTDTDCFQLGQVK